MKEKGENDIEVEIREHSDADFFPDKCPACKARDVKRFTYHLREIPDLGTPLICRRIHYERVYFKCNECGEVFTIEHPLIPINARYMPGVIKYAVVRVLEKGDSIRRVTQDLNELHLVKVSETTVQRWINERGNKEGLPTDLSTENPPENFSGFLSLDGTFKSVKVKKNDRNMAR
jgi:transposase